MADKKRKWDVYSDDKRKECIDSIIGILDQNRDVGMITAGAVLDVVADIIGPDIYNAALKDARKVIAEKSQDLEIDLDLLAQS